MDDSNQTSQPSYETSCMETLKNALISFILTAELENIKYLFHGHLCSLIIERKNELTIIVKLLCSASSRRSEGL